MSPTRAPLALALAATLALTACRSGEGESPGERIRAATADASREIAESAANVATDVRTEMSAENLKLDADDSSLPDAEITPEGGILIGGEALVLDDAQRALALEYRQGIIELAASGADIGVQAASIATEAIGDAIAGIVTGEPVDVEAKAKAKGEQIETAARQLCDRLPALVESQRALVEAVPQMAPYARVKSESRDENNCHIEA